MGGVYTLSLREASEPKNEAAVEEDASDSDVEREPMIEHEEERGVELNHS